MPVWHDRMRGYVTSGELALLGVTQEQHRERCQLFAQWQRFDWPILHDPINALQSRAVPIVLAIDEHGIVRLENPRPEDIGPQFIEREFLDDAEVEAAVPWTPSYPPDWAAMKSRAESTNLPADWQRLGDAAALWGTDTQWDTAIEAYQQVLARDAAQAMAWFRLGVCLRMRYEQPPHRAEDFRQAIAAWGRSLELDPNQYIWRRRIQQYGPRLEKPYPFYDWVEAAEDAIRARGESPVELPVRPDGAELAQPIRSFDGVQDAPAESDAAIEREDQAVGVEIVVVPDRIEPGRTARIHLIFQPQRESLEQWDPEAEPVQVHLVPPPAVLVSAPFVAQGSRSRPPSLSDPLTIGYEILVPEDARDSVRVPGYALYNLCHQESGQCRYVRHDFEIVVPIRAK